MAQGFPDFPASEEVKEAARQAISDDINQYAITWGAKELRDAIARKFERTQGVRVDPEREITVTCGSTEAMMAAMMGIINPGDEVVIFEPHYENYGPDAILSGATPRFVQLRPPDWNFDRDELTRAFGPKTKAIIVNTPNNPTGKVFSREELEFIRDLCVRWNAFAVTDEIYEHIIYDGAKHISMASLDGMRDRTITINGMSKTYSVTGWRVGWAIAPPEASIPIRKVHDFLTVGAAAPLQQAGAIALELPPSYYEKLAEMYLVKRDRMLGILGRSRLPLLQARGRVLHHDRYFGLQFSGRSCHSRDISLRKSASPSCPVRAFTTIRRWARARSASHSAKKNRRSRLARKSYQNCAPDGTSRRHSHANRKNPIRGPRSNAPRAVTNH